MSFQFSGLVSGLNSNQIISRLVAIERRPIDALKTKVSNINNELSVLGDIGGRLSALNASIKAFTDARLSDTNNVFNSRTATSSNTGAVTASVAANTAPNSFNIAVSQLATKTRVKTGSLGLGNPPTDTTPLNQIYGGITSGNITYSFAGQTHTLTINKDTDTIQSLETQIKAQTSNSNTFRFETGGQAILQGGEFKFGFGSDTSNLAQVLKLTTAAYDSDGIGTTYASGRVSTINPNGTLIGNAARLYSNSITAGSFSINGVSFAVNASTTLNGLVSAINSSSTANVKATIDTNTNNFILESKVTGSTAVALNDNGTGVLQTFGLVLGSNTLFNQTLGKNAEFSINGGATQVSQSNTISPSVSGLDGITLNLLAPTGGIPSTITVAQNTENVLAKAQDFVAKYNDLLESIDSQTAKDQALAGNSGIKRLRSQLITAAGGTGKFATGQSTLQGTLQTLASIGISTGAASASIVPGQAPSRSLKLDESTFLDKLNSSPDEVRRAFIGNQIFSNMGVPGFTPQSGVLSVLDSVVTGASDPISGIISSRTTSANSQITSINKSIDRGETRIAKFQQNLQHQYAVLEQLMSKYKSQGSALAGIGY